MLEAILRHPALYTGPRMVKPPVVYIAGLLRGLGPRDRHDVVGLARRGRRPAALLPAERRRLGRLPLARHERVPRPLVDREQRAREGLARRQEGQEGAEGAERPRGDRQGRARRARQPDDPARDARASCSAFARGSLQERDRLEGGGLSPARRRTRSASCSPSPPTSRPADGAAATSIRAPSCCGGPRRGGPRPAGDRAGHAHAGGHRPRPAHASSPAASASRSPSTAARRCGPRRSTRGSRQPQPRAPQQKVLVSVFLDGGADSLSLLSPTGDPLYRQLRPRLALPAGAGTAVRARIPSLTWHPSLAPLAAAARRGQGQRHARDRLRPPEPVALHLAALLGGRRARTSVSRRAGSAATSTGSAAATTRSRASRSTGACSPRSPRRRCPSPPSTRPDRYDFWARGVWGEVSERMVDTIGRLGALPTHGDPGPRGGNRRGAPVGPALRAADAVPTEGRPQDARQPGRLPARRRRLPPPPRRPRGDARRRPAAPRRRALGTRAATTRTTTRPHDLADGLKLTADSLLAFQRDLEARGLADRVLVHVWSEFGRRAKENGSGGTDHGAAGTGFLIGSRVAGTMIGEFPGLATLDARRQPPRDRRLPRALRRDARGLARDGCRRDHPGRAQVRAGRRSCDETDARRRRPWPCWPSSRVAPAAAPATGTGAGVGRRVLASRSRAQSIRSGTGDRRARQLRRGRPRSRAAPDRRDARTYRIGIVHPGATGELETRLARRPLPALVHARRPSRPWYASDVARQALVRSDGAGAVRQLRPPPSSDSISMKTLKMSRKIEAASSGAASICPASAEPLEVVHRVPGEDDQPEDGVDHVATRDRHEEHHEPEDDQPEQREERNAGRSCVRSRRVA